MEFRIYEISRERVILKPTGTNRIVQRITFILACILLPIALLLFFDDFGNSVGHILFGSALFFWGFSWMAKRARNIHPARLEFDNTHGLVRFFQKRHHAYSEDVVFPYSRFNGFSVIEQHHNRHTFYSVVLTESDGYVLPLHSHTLKKSAFEEMEKLRNSVDFSKASGVPNNNLPQGLTKEHEGGKTTFRWQFGFFSYQNFSAFLGIIGFFYMLLAIAKTSGVSGVVIVWLFAVGIGGIFFYFVYRWAGASAELQIGDEQIRYFEVRGFSKKERHSIKLNEFKACAAYAINRDSELIVFVLKEDENKMLQNIVRGEVSLAEIVSALQFIRKVFKVYTPLLALPQRIFFADEIEKEVKQRIHQ
ncbi:MAG: hypothetical protein LDLANPLL_02595 [Turneriella sp.]|nr:hypothetical protein [Turneriella sp.]